VTEQAPRSRSVPTQPPGRDPARPSATCESDFSHLHGSYEAHTKPPLGEDDRRAMSFAFDRWSSDDVTKHADAILGQLEDGTMPCERRLAGGSSRFLPALVRARRPRLGSMRVAENAKKEDVK
jgi:hypothetical protein